MEAIVIESEPAGIIRYGQNQLNPLNQLENFRSHYLLPEKDSQGKETLRYRVDLDIPGYQALQRLLLLSGYEVICEGKKKEGSVQKHGTLYARVQSHQSIDVLFEAVVNTNSIDNGFSYQRLQGSAEFTQFLRDYETLPLEGRSYRGIVRGGILGGGLGGGLGSFTFMTSMDPSLAIFTLGVFGFVGTFIGMMVGDISDTANYRNAILRFLNTYQSKLLTGKEAVCTALGLPVMEEEKKVG